ncbi:hypothetical protein KDA_75350 [Dictyobacter alpinus]|uniref:Uncharacterized protein n=1 Tax=Dictyobacter alpinus TaxID=2014873 RepID=A0A402BL33_9CHLR|nr:hypothetical protein [Dictyobacter alpinus]GCE32051.1 hypothetical protein KDA_75350 [Dictyobacter alpinus]
MDYEETKQRKKLSLQEMSRGRYHALKDACVLLDPPADPRTLRGWIADLAIETYQSPVQGNTVLISHKDLVALATLVGRSMKEDGRPTGRKGVEKIVEPTTLEELRTQHTREIAALHRRIESLQARHSEETKRLMQEIERLKQGTEPRAKPSETTERAIPPPYVPAGQMKPHRLPTDLPEGSVSMRSFTVSHGTTRDIMTAAAKRQDIRAMSRPYGGDETRVQYFLDPQMQDEAVEWLVRMGYGYRCEQCPHEQNKQT